MERTFQGKEISMKVKPWNQLERRQQLMYLYIYQGHGRLSSTADIPKQYIRSLEKMQEARRKETERELDETYNS
jgi:hypothetical protein